MKKEATITMVEGCTLPECVAHSWVELA